MILDNPEFLEKTKSIMERRALSVPKYVDVLDKVLGVKFHCAEIGYGLTVPTSLGAL